MAAKVTPVAGQKLHTPEAYFEGKPQKHMASSETGDTALSGVVKQIKISENLWTRDGSRTRNPKKQKKRMPNKAN